MAWRAARSLLVLHRQLQAGAPRAKPPATGADEWGLLGDAAHDPTSDHSPHDFPGLGSQVVTAADFPNRPDLGLDAHRVLDDIRRSRDPRAKYGISDSEIFSNHAVTQGGRSYAAWEWRPYRHTDGSRYSDEHYTHGHLSVVGDARADGEQPWATIGGTDMDTREHEQNANADTYLWKLVSLEDQVTGILSDGKTVTVPNVMGQLLKRLEGKVDGLVSRPALDLGAFAAALAPLLADALPAEVDAAAVLAVLESDAGQAALTQASNRAEDS